MQPGYIPRIIPEQVRYLELRVITKPQKMVVDFSLTYNFETCRDQLWAMLKGFFASSYADLLCKVSGLCSSMQLVSNQYYFRRPRCRSTHRNYDLIILVREDTHQGSGCSILLSKIEQFLY